MNFCGHENDFLQNNRQIVPWKFQWCLKLDLIEIGERERKTEKGDQYIHIWFEEKL